MVRSLYCDNRSGRPEYQQHFDIQALEKHVDSFNIMFHDLHCTYLENRESRSYIQPQGQCHYSLCTVLYKMQQIMNSPFCASTGCQRRKMVASQGSPKSHNGSLHAAKGRRCSRHGGWVLSTADKISDFAMKLSMLDRCYSLRSRSKKFENMQLFQHKRRAPRECDLPDVYYSARPFFLAGILLEK